MVELFKKRDVCWLVIHGEGKDGIIVQVDRDGVSLTPEEAVDLATKIINHCYPFTRPKRDE